MGSKSRRKWSSKEKLRIVMAGLDGKTEISELCRREGISATQYDNWKNQLVQSADQVFGRSTGKRDRHQERLETDLVRAKDVIAEITNSTVRRPNRHGRHRFALSGWVVMMFASTKARTQRTRESSRY